MCDCSLVSNPRVLCEGHQIALTELLEQVNQDNMTRAVDVLQQAALGLAGMTAVDVRDVPRLMVQAACRGVEKLIELHSRKQQQGRLSMEEDGALKIAIKDAAADLLKALDEGRDMASQIISSLDAKPAID